MNVKERPQLSRDFNTSILGIQGNLQTSYKQIMQSQLTPLFSPFWKRVIFLLPPEQVDVFTIKAIDLGELKKLRIRHDNSGSSPSWFLERVEIVDLKESTT